MLRPPSPSKRLRDIAEALFTLANDLEAQDDQRPLGKSPRAIMSETLANVAEMIAAGIDPTNAIPRAASRAGLEYYHVAKAWEHTQHKNAAQDLYARRYMARQLMTYGIDRDTVAEIVGCHPNHIARMIKALQR